MSDSADEHRDAPLPVVAGDDGALAARLAKIVRLGTMLGQLLEELHRGAITEDTCAGLRPHHELAVRELGTALSADLQAELGRITPGLSSSPSCAELRIAEAQVLGWLQGLLPAVQAEAVALAAAESATAQQRDVNRPVHDPSYL